MQRLKTYTLILITIIIFTVYEELVLRKWLFNNHIKPAFLAGSLPNFLAVLLFCFGFMVVKRTVGYGAIFRGIVCIVAGVVLYEFVQLVMPNMVFDIADIIASIAGGALSLGIVWTVERNNS